MSVSESLRSGVEMPAEQPVSAPLHEASASEPGIPFSEQEIYLLLAQHKEWVESQGLAGQRLELADLNCEGKDLAGFSFRGAALHKANFRRAELLLADLRGAHLVQADFREANLLGADLEGADLQGARFGASSGLATRKLAKANLVGAELPESLLDFEGLRVANSAYDKARFLFWTMAAITGIGCAGLALSSDVQLLRNLPLPFVGSAIPMGGFFFAVPILLVFVYLFFHLALHRLNERLAELPVVFPDGRPIERAGHWEQLGFLSGQIRGASSEPRPMGSWERALSRLFCDWMAPAALLLFWARYLVLQQMRASLLHIILFAATTTFAIYAQSLPSIGVEPNNRLIAKMLQMFPQIRKSLLPARTAAIITAVLLLLSMGTIYGAPHDVRRAPGFSSMNARRWVANLFWIVGYDPYAHLTESNVTTKPKNWLGRDQDVPSVSGAILNKASLRYAEAYRSFWVNAHLWQANLEGASLSESDFRGANLRETNLQFARLDHSLLGGANLQNAHLNDADLTGADLHDADLSFVVADNAQFIGARMPGTNLFSADLRMANLDHADLQKADLRETHLDSANMPQANLQGAYLWSAQLSGSNLRDSRFQGAILIEANLRKADLRGAVFQAAIIRSADFTGALIDDADLRGAIGITAQQICSAASRNSVELDDELQEQVTARCASAPR